MQSQKYEQAVVHLLKRQTIVCEQTLPVENRRQLLECIRHLCRVRMLSQWVHLSGLTYWTRFSPRSLSDQSLARSFGIAVFQKQSQQRMIVTHEEIARWFPDLFRHGLRSGHYVDQMDGRPTLGHVHVDANNSKVNRLTNRTLRLIQKYRSESGFRQLIDAGQFELTWIVPTRVKQLRLTETLDPLATSGVHLQVIEIPELLNILSPIPRQ